MADYRDVDLVRARAGEALALDTSAPVVEQVGLAAGVHVLAGPGAAADSTDTADRVGPWSELQDCHRVDGQGFAAAGLSADALDDGGIRLTAVRHSACVHADLPASPAGRRLTLTLPYRSVRGAAPRLCLFDTVQQRCLPLTGDVVDGSRLAVSQRPERAVLAVEATGNPLALYVYADGSDAGTLAEYGRPVYHPAAAEVVTVTEGRTHATSSDRPPAADVELLAHDGHEVRIRVRVDRPGAVLATTEAFDPGWALHGLPPAVSARHVRLDGYRNGWVIDGTGTFELTIRFGSSRAALGLRYAAASMALVLTARALRGRSVPGRRPG
ncbi:MAG: hypothetical protein IT196_01155 [Acidimicrobiales bacterium]|nr:hypothetical protein [Acidimicrobiales bacterium]